MSQKARNNILLMIFILLGIMIAIQFRSTHFTRTQKAAASLDAEKLKKQLIEEKNLEENYKTGIKQYEAKIEEYLKVDTAKNESLKKDKLYLDYLKMASGLTDVKGPGVIIRLNDALLKKGEVKDANPFIIHDSDIIKILNELKKAGAQAISINDERIIATSEQVCAGPTIRINQNRHPVPYEIKVIGDSEQLYRAFDKSDRVAILRGLKIRVEIDRVKEITIPKYNGNINRLISGLEVINQ